MTDILAAIVTGSSRGIGREIVLQLARDGYGVVVNYVSRADAAEQIVAQIADFGGRAIAIGANIGIGADRDRLVAETMERFGRIDVLVNNAGITSQGRKDLLDATEESWDLVFDTNLKGPFFLSQQVAGKMIGAIQSGTMSKATIVNVSSISAYAASANRADYCIAKSSMGMMTQLFAARLADENIRVFELCPGIIASDMTAPVKQKYDKLIADGLTPIRRWGSPDDVAKAVTMLVGDSLPFSTGQRIDVDGGFHIRTL